MQSLPPKPEWVPEWVYTQALAARWNYKQNWEMWVWGTAQRHNCSIAKAEDACIRGIQKDVYRYHLIYGERIGRWYGEFIDVSHLFRKVNHPQYLPKLGSNQ